MKTVNEARLEAYGNDFPWFLEWFQERQAASRRACGYTIHVGTCRVGRVDLELCQRVTGNHESIGIFDAQGRCLGFVGWNGKQKGFLEYISDVIFGEGFNRECLDPSETVEMAIDRLTKTGSVPFYVVTHDWSFDHGANSHVGTGVIHKPKGKSLPAWLAEIRGSQSAQLKKDLAAIG